MPVRMGDLFDVSPEDRDDKSLLSYENSSGNFKFRDINSDLSLQKTSEDSDLPDDFVRKVEDEVDVDKIIVVSYDAGTFWV